jgi:hypothetical protein
MQGLVEQEHPRLFEAVELTQKHRRGSQADRAMSGR